MIDEKLSDQFVFPNGDYYEGQYIFKGSEIVRHGKGLFIGNFRKRMLDVPIPNSLDQSYKSLSETFSEYKYSEDFDVSTLCDLFLESGPNQGCYIGEWVNDKIEGNGKVHFPSGSYYEGNFKDNKMDGIGTYYWPSGHILKAEFEQNNIREDSLIELIDPDGKQWTGRFKRHQHQQQQQQQQVTANTKDKVSNETQMFFNLNEY